MTKDHATSEHMEQDSPIMGASPKNVREMCMLISQQVEQERSLAWREELERDKINTLDHEREVPAPDVTPWLNLKQQDAQPDPLSTKDIFARLDRNEVGDAELFIHLCGKDYRFDHSKGSWLRFGGVTWDKDSVGQAQRAVMGIVADMYESAGDDRYRYFAEQAEKVNPEVVRLEQELQQAKANGDDKEDIETNLKTAKAEFSRYMNAANNGRKKAQDRARQLRSNRRARDVLRVSSLGNSSLGMTGDEFDQHPTLLAFSNGVLDMESGRLLKPDRNLFLTMGSPLEFPGLNAHDDWFEDLLRKVFCGDEELMDYFGMTIAYSVTGLRANKDFFCAIGPLADNGKSTVFNAIKDAVGSVATTIRVEVLLEKDRRGGSSGPDPDLMVLDGLRMGIASEATAKQRFSADQIKAITGDDGVRARGMYTDTKLLRSDVKLWLHTNKVPNLSEYDAGFVKRLRLLPFNAQFMANPEEVDPARHKYPMLPKGVIDAKRKAALPAVAAWIARYAVRFFKNGMQYQTPQCVIDTSTNYFDEQDSIGAFLEAACEFDKSAPNLPSAKLYSAFKLWCKEVLCIEEKMIIKSKGFSQSIKERPGVIIERTRPAIVWGNIRLISEWEEKVDKLNEQEK